MVEVDRTVELHHDMSVVGQRQEVNSEEVGADHACGLNCEGTLVRGRLCL